MSRSNETPDPFTSDRMRRVPTAFDRQCTILVVDDEVDIAESIGELLEASVHNVRVATASNGAQGLERLRAQPPDVILADYRMPEMDGLEFLAAARREAPNVPRVMITAFPEMDVAIRAINEGEIERFLAKPFDPLELVGIVHDILDDRRAREMRYQAFARAFDVLRKTNRVDAS